jgi:c-di-GMP-related signal transduction protein
MILFRALFQDLYRARVDHEQKAPAMIPGLFSVIAVLSIVRT